MTICHPILSAITALLAGWRAVAKKQLRARRGRPVRALVLAAVSLLAISLVPVTAKAVELGELTLLSKFGQPLYATVAIRLAMGETIDASCLSVGEVEDGDSSSSSALFKTGLRLRFNPSARRIEIRSRSPFTEPYAAFRLQVQCPGAAAVISGEFALLPEHESAPPVAVVNAIPAELAKPAPIAKPVIPAEQPVKSKPADLAKQEAVKTSPASPAISVKAAPVPSPVAERRPDEAGSSPQLLLQLRLTDGELDMARVGQLGQADLAAIQAQRKLLEADDPGAQQLAMQNQFKAMTEELQTARLKLANLEANKTAPAPKAAGEAWRNPLLLSAALLALVLAFFGMRHFRDIKDRLFKLRSANAEPAKPQVKNTVGETTARLIYPQGGKPLQPISAIRGMVDRQPAEKPQDEALDKEEQTVLEEAELYAVYGHPDKAVKILQEFVSKTPQSENAWMLLLSIYSAGGQIGEFEIVARKFLSNCKNSPQWKTIQALGRTLDKDNELYADKEALWLPSSRSKQRPIGDILIDLGYLSAQDLANCLGEFEPKQHGRFGHYLLTRRMINHAQLNEALLKQQADREEKAPEDDRPDLLQHTVLTEPLAEALEPEAVPSATARAQDTAFPLDFVIDAGTPKPVPAEFAAPRDLQPDLLQQTIMTRAYEQLATENPPEVVSPATAQVQNNAFPLDFVIDEGTPKSVPAEFATPREEITLEADRPELLQRTVMTEAVTAGNELFAAAPVQDNAFTLILVTDEGAAKSIPAESATAQAENQVQDLEFKIDLDSGSIGDKPREI